MAESILAIFGALIYIVFVVIVLTAFLPVFNDLACSNYKSQLDTCNSQLSSLNTQIISLNSTAEFYKQQYENLTTTNITKKDFTDIQNNINQVQYQITNVNNRIELLNQEIINIQNVRNFYLTFSISVAINLLSVGFLLVDFAFFNFDLSKRIAKRVLGKLKRKHEHPDSLL